MIYIAVAQRDTDLSAEQPSVSGNGLTWSLLRTNHSLGLRVSLFAAVVNQSTAGAITITVSQVQDEIAWSVFEVTDSFNLPTNLADNSTANGTSLTATLSAFQQPDNISIGAFLIFADEAITPGSGFTSIHTFSVAGAWRILTEYKVNDTTVDCSWTTSTAARGVAAEHPVGVPFAVGMIPIK